MSATIEWDEGKIEQGRKVEGTSYIIGSYKASPLDEALSCEVCGGGLEEISLKFVSFGSGEMVTGGVEVSGWTWCPICREKRGEV